MTKIKIALAQLNFCVGDIAGNLQKHLLAIDKAKKLGADLVIFPELSLTGYSPEDLLLRPAFISAATNALDELVAKTTGIDVLAGHPHREDKLLYNCCSLIRDGHIVGQYAKQCLPNYSVFDEYRYFTPGNQAFIATIKNIPTGIVICEDVWQQGPIDRVVAAGAKLIIIINASPFEINKHDLRLSLLTNYAKKYHTPIVYVNHVGGQDEIIFDGGSMMVNENGELCQFAGCYNEVVFPIDIDIAQVQPVARYQIPNINEKIYQGLVLSVRDYIEKNNFSGVLIGVSGGIDSALVLAIAVDALGKDKVKAVMMPSRYSAEISLEDSISLVKNLDVNYEIISIEPVYQEFLDLLSPQFKNKKNDITEENMQARCRAILLMALSNKFGSLVLVTSNRSELAVGYCTIYGDMAGGFAVLKDIPKMLVYELSHYRNQLSFVIPQRILERPPSAELAFDQKDEDSLPPYSILDRILYAYLNLEKSIDEIVAEGFDRALVTKIINLIHKSEYKRRQAAIGPRINYKSFGKDWRYPITNKFKM